MSKGNNVLLLNVILIILVMLLQQVSSVCRALGQQIYLHQRSQMPLKYTEYNI